MNDSNQKATMSEQEFCAAVGISPATAYRLRKAGKLPYCHIGRRILYLKRHIEELLTDHEKSAKPKRKIGF